MLSKKDLYICLVNYVNWSIPLEKMDQIFWSIYYNLINQNITNKFTDTESTLFNELIELFSRYSLQKEGWSLSWEYVSNKLNTILIQLWITKETIILLKSDTLKSFYLC